MACSDAVGMTSSHNYGIDSSPPWLEMNMALFERNRRWELCACRCNCEASIPEGLEGSE
jgi:hypothetical protein